MSKSVRLKDVPWYGWAGYSAGIIAWFLNIFMPHLELFAISIVFLVGATIMVSVLHKEMS